MEGTARIWFTRVRHDYDDTALRKELTAGCLIEKGATGTIYFGHRSLGSGRSQLLISLPKLSRRSSPGHRSS